MVYNGDICSVEEIKSLEERYGERLAGVMIGRGLLARPSLAQEYASESTLSPSMLIMKIKQMHEGLLEHYKKVIPGEAQQLMKIRSFWDYMEPTIGRKQWKKIVKAGNMKNYLLKGNELTSCRVVCRGRSAYLPDKLTKPHPHPLHNERGVISSSILHVLMSFSE